MESKSCYQYINIIFNSNLFKCFSTAETCITVNSLYKTRMESTLQNNYSLYKVGLCVRINQPMNVMCCFTEDTELLTDLRHQINVHILSRPRWEKGARKLCTCIKYSNPHKMLKKTARHAHQRFEKRGLGTVVAILHLEVAVWTNKFLFFLFAFGLGVFHCQSSVCCSRENT